MVAPRVGPGRDGIAVEIALDILRKLIDGCVPPRRLLAQRHLNNVGKIGVDAGERLGRSDGNGVRQPGGALGVAIRQASAQHPVKQDSGGICRWRW